MNCLCASGGAGAGGSPGVPASLILKTGTRTLQTGAYRQYLVRPLMAVGSGFITVVNWFDVHNGFVTALATIAIALLTFVYVRYSRAQWAVMREQLNEMKTASALDQRAWVGTIDESQLTFTLGQNVVVVVPVKNSGKTPALMVTTVAAMRTIDTGRFPEFNDLKEPTGVGVIQPNAATYMSIFSKEVLTQEIVEELTRGDRVLWIYGTITYNDIFSHHHWTTFAKTLNPIKKVWETPPVHNEVDNENR
jgi:hypothetical protein